MLNPTFYSKGRIEASHGDLITANTNDLEWAIVFTYVC